MIRFNLIWIIFFFSCRSLVTTYEDVESAIYYEDASQESAEFNDTLKVMTWNIRFGAGRIPFFGDSCGDRVLMTEPETLGYMDSIIVYINSTQPDVLLLQEVDISSKRSAYVNQLQYILDHTHLNYGAYASMWNAEIIASDGLGKVDAGNAILSIYNMNGENVWELKMPSLIAGNYTVPWNGRNMDGSRLESGIYIYRLTINEVSQSRKLILLK